jgi:hypothetical protein
VDDILATAKMDEALTHMLEQVELVRVARWDSEPPDDKVPGTARWPG